MHLPLIYGSGSAATSALFFTELADVVDRLATFVESVYVVSDVNMRLERPCDPDALEFNDDIDAHGLVNCVTSPTHIRRGMLDVVVTRADSPSPRVDVVEVGLSDHYPLRWSVPAARQCPVYVSTSSRQWKRPSAADFRTALAASPLCESDAWSSLVVDGLARLYDTDVSSIVDRLVPVHTVRCRRRISDAWFDDECGIARHRVRLFECDIRRIRRRDPDNDAAISAATAVWSERRREYRNLLREKRETS